MRSLAARKSSKNPKKIKIIQRLRAISGLEGESAAEARVFIVRVSGREK
jgi:hypothetical protein